MTITMSPVNLGELPIAGGDNLIIVCLIKITPIQYGERMKFEIQISMTTIPLVPASLMLSSLSLLGH